MASNPTSFHSHIFNLQSKLGKSLLPDQIIIFHLFIYFGCVSFHSCLLASLQKCNISHILNRMSFVVNNLQFVWFEMIWLSTIVFIYKTINNSIYINQLWPTLKNELWHGVNGKIKCIYKFCCCVPFSQWTLSLSHTSCWCLTFPWRFYK